MLLETNGQLKDGFSHNITSVSLQADERSIAVSTETTKCAGHIGQIWQTFKMRGMMFGPGYEFCANRAHESCNYVINLPKLFCPVSPKSSRSLNGVAFSGQFMFKIPDLDAD